jgi:CRISPR/Cas system-associated exonuclease Cas4 (RecB family)
MLSVNLYQNSVELFSLDFIKDKNLKTIVVCPSPLLADDFRSQVSQNQSVGDLNVVTISKFMGEELAIVKDDLSVFRKADLIMHLSTLWKSSYPELGHETFFQAFNLFTELRSYTLNLDLVKEILVEFDPIVAEAVQKFWLYLEYTEIVDEQCSYQLLAESYRTPKTTEQEQYNIIINGFNHLNAGQVDLIKALGIRHNVYVPFPKDVFSETLSSDWVRWLRPEDSEEITEVRTSRPINLISFAKNRLSEKLSDFYKNDKLASGADIFLGVKNPDMNQLNEVSFGGYFFKAKNDLFNTIASSVFEVLKNKFISKKKSIAADELIDHVSEIIQNELCKSLENKNYRLIKICHLIKSKLQEMKELSEQNVSLTLLDIHICEYVTRLNFPRTFSAPLLEEGVKGIIKGLEGIEGFNSELQTIICVTSQYMGIRGGDNKYNEEVMKFLATIGPMQRKDLEYKLIKKRLREVLTSENTTLFMEQGLTDHDLGWSEIIDGLDINNISLDINRENKELKDHIKSIINKEASELKSYSASRLQTYIDCPRKYYFQYVDKLAVRPQADCTVRADQLGTLEHDIIGEYLENNKEFDEKKHVKLVEDMFNQFIDKLELTLNEFSYDRFLIELKDYSRNGIENLLKLKELDPKLEYIFEYNIAQDYPFLSGRIDCLIKGDFGVGMIDFKRSQGSIPTKAEIDKFDKIQLWFYLKHYDPSPHSYSFWGFMDLSDVESSRVFTADKDMSTALSGVEFLDKCRFVLNENLGAGLQEYSEIEKETLVNINNEKKYEPLPRKADVCTFCSVANICPRKILEVSL